MLSEINKFDHNCSVIEHFKGYSESASSVIKGIPCLFLRCNEPSSKLLIHFHGNAEDLGRAREFLNVMRTCLSVHVLAVEYPGYGIYQG